MSRLKYTHLNLSSREVLGNRLANGESIPSIAKAMGVHHTTLYRELKRNSRNIRTRVNKPHQADLDGRRYRGTSKSKEIRDKKLSYQKRLHLFRKNGSPYEPKYAQDLAATRLACAHMKQPKLLLPEFSQTLTRVHLKLGERSSPKQIELHLRKSGLPEVSENSIYRYLEHYAPELKQHLRRRGRARRKPSSLTWNKASRMRSIHARPIEVETLSRPGDLEGDTIFGLDPKDRLLTHVDRLTGLGSISLVLGYNSTSISEQTNKDLARMFGYGVHTVTYDRGNEFSLWEKTEQRSGVDIYFADPYSSYQRGRNENFNGLVRDFFPKGTDFKKITRKDILRVESILNNRERERFNGLTPIEMSRVCALGVEE